MSIKGQQMQQTRNVTKLEVPSQLVWENVSCALPYQKAHYAQSC